MATLLLIPTLSISTTLLMKFLDFEFDDSLEFMRNISESSNAFKEVQSEPTITPDLDLMKLSPKERYSFIQGLEGINHSNHIFSGHIYKKRLMMVCAKCIE